MKNVSTILSILSLAGVAGLFVMQFAGGSSTSKSANAAAKTDSHTHGQVGYFEMDSIEQHYAFVKNVRDQLKKDEDNITAELGGMKKNYMGRIQQLQAKAPTMSQQEGEAAQAEINQMQMTLQQREAKLTQDLQEKQFKMMKEINDKIADFLKTFNANKKYAYIISRSPGDFVYFADSTYNITDEVIKGLNAAYKQ
ncbi:OmpH family outer membrane protein [Phnomibacter sp. MR]|uniref:OmpH family outer membrane protein n=1 Tax=Phnomibacter sp. MR TaxID=3042318 RepID=UPI003A7FBC06|nr:OmpH family outer membrane protein [Chitinophagaceae bacterium]